MCEAFGIVNYEGANVLVKGMQDYRPVAAFSFLGRYRMIDFPISNLSNSGVDIWEPVVTITSTPNGASCTSSRQRI